MKMGKTEKRILTMNRVLAFVLMLTLLAITPLSVLAESEETVGEEKKEILFQGIPWDSDANTVRKMLLDKGFPMSEVRDYYAISYFAPASFDASGKSDCGVGMSADAVALQALPVKIAGYPIKYCWTTFVFDYEDKNINENIEDTHFIYGSVTFDTLNPQYMYDDLVKKLSSLYGEPENVIAKSISTTSYFKTGEKGTNYCDYSVWYGANDTAVLLEYRYEIMNESFLRKDESLKLIYGKTNGKEKVTALEILIEKKAEEEKQRQLEIERQIELEKLQQNQNDDVSGL